MDARVAVDAIARLCKQARGSSQRKSISLRAGASETPQSLLSLDRLLAALPPHARLSDHRHPLYASPLRLLCKRVKPPSR
jgi:hypothetical protein